jgi:hypothetical protein
MISSPSRFNVIGLILAGVGVFFLYRPFRMEAASRERSRRTSVFRGSRTRDRHLERKAARRAATGRGRAAKGRPGRKGNPPPAPRPPDSHEARRRKRPPAERRRIRPCADGDILQNLKRRVLDAREGGGAAAARLAAPIFRLRGGGLALALDHLESEKFLGFQASGFRYFRADAADAPLDPPLRRLPC